MYRTCTVHALVIIETTIHPVPIPSSLSIQQSDSLVKLHIETAGDFGRQRYEPRRSISLD